MKKLIMMAYYTVHGAMQVDHTKKTHAYHYAKWQPEEDKKGGTFVYAIDRDAKKDSDDTITMTDFA